MSSNKMIDGLEVTRHSSKNSCWVVIHGHVYDLTDFLAKHPGGASVILENAGQDVTKVFDSFHSSDVINKYLDSKQNLGKVVGHLPTAEHRSMKNTMSALTDIQQLRRQPSIRSIINIHDFEVAASNNLPPRSFAFIKAGADNEGTAVWNHKAWQAIRFRPRVLQPVDKVDTSVSIFENRFSAPFFIGPAGGGKLAHPDGEISMTRAAAKHGILQWVCNNAGCTQKEMADARGPGQILYWQIYAMSNLETTENEIRHAIALGYKGFALTVDGVQIGKRERDMRLHIAESADTDVDDSEEDEYAGLTGGISVSRPAVYDKFDWVSAIQWLKKLTSLPIAIKGIQCWEDAALCMRHGVHPWLSNHGGRQLDGAPAAAETLVEIRQHCPEVFNKCEVIVDGGITRGTDIVKALALGAKGVGLGRGFLFSLNYGEKGVNRAILILKQEMETSMALLGCTSIDQLTPALVDTSGLSAAAGVIRAML